MALTPDDKMYVQHKLDELRAEFNVALNVKRERPGEKVEVVVPQGILAKVRHWLTSRLAGK